MSKLRTTIKENSLGYFFGIIFLISLVGQAFVGQAHYNNEEAVNGLEPISIFQYVTSASFATDVAENWQSEYLQFLLYVFGTIWFIQRGSSESKSPDQVGHESDRRQLVGRHATTKSPKAARSEGLRAKLYSNSLGLLMVVIFLGSWFAQSISGWSAFNEQRLGDLQDPISWVAYVTGADFWSRTLQNWQSEFLAVGSFAVFTIYLRQRSSPESKPVGASHDQTGT